MDLSIKFETAMSRWPIIYIEGSQVIISKILSFFLPKISCVLANSADPSRNPGLVPLSIYRLVKRCLFDLSLYVPSTIFQLNRGSCLVIEYSRDLKRL